MSHTTSFLSELAEITNAATRLPTIEAELDRTKGELSVANEKLDRAYAGQNNLQDEINRLRAELTATEAALSDATFRESETRSQLQMLVGTFRSVIGDASAAVELVEPPKLEPVNVPNEVSPSPPADPVGTASNGGVSVQSDPMTGVSSQISTESVPTPSVNAPIEAPAATGEGQGAAPSTATTQTDVTTANSVPTTDANTPRSDTTDLPGTFPWQGQSASNPTPAASTTGTTTNSEVTAGFEPQPYFDRPYWQKPDSISWKTWIAGGGNRAPWINADGDDRYHDVITP